MSCIGTAGHIDHGKSALVTALTGMDPDRLAEEKARSMTIDLGFAWLTLPSGREASIVDVPGHEGFIKNMLAGVGGIDVALLVIAADEGVMPQTAEHLAILDLLRVRCGVVALTKRDLVDDEWLALVRDEVAETLRPTTLAAAPIIPCSAVTGAGVPELLDALDAALDQAPTPRDIGRARLPIDRVFTITGFGTVVTGTLQDGSLHLGQEVEILPAGVRARIRGLQAHKQSVEVGTPGGRLAVNLAGIAKSELSRGEVLCLPGTLRATTAMDVRLDAISGAPRPIAHNGLVDVYLGAAEVPARVVLLDADELAPGASAWAQLRLARPLVAAHGDRFIVRVPSPSMTVGGGVVIEPWARRHRRHDTQVLAHLDVLARGEPEEIVLATLRGMPGRRTSQRGPARLAASQSAGRGPRAVGLGGMDTAAIAVASGLPAAQVAQVLTRLRSSDAVLEIGSRCYAVETWNRLRAESTRLLTAYHRQYPLRGGMPREEWRARLGLEPAAAGDVLRALAAADEAAEATTERRGAFVRLPGHEPKLSPEQERAAAALLARFCAAPFTPPTRAEVDEALGSEAAGLLVEQGRLVRLSEEIVLDREAHDEMLRRVVGHLRGHERLTVAEARDLLGTTRKYMLAMFEYLDERHITQRQGDDRVLGPRAPALPPSTAPRP